MHKSTFRHRNTARYSITLPGHAMKLRLAHVRDVLAVTIACVVD